MSRNPNYERIDKDLYETPESVIEAYYVRYNSYFRDDSNNCKILEPSCGSGKISRYFKSLGYSVYSNDVQNLYNDATISDYLSDDFVVPKDIGMIITNPPYSKAQEFIEKSLLIAKSFRDVNKPITISMLLNTDFDHAQKRKHLFGGCYFYDSKLVLCNRIVWFPGKVKASPQYNHAWFTWHVPNEINQQRSIPKIYYHYKKGHHKHVDREIPLDE